MFGMHIQVTMREQQSGTARDVVRDRKWSTCVTGVYKVPGARGVRLIMTYEVLPGESDLSWDISELYDLLRSRGGREFHTLKM